MVNTTIRSQNSSLSRFGELLGVYVVIVVATLVTLVLLTTLGSHGVRETYAGNEAWGHAVIVAVFAILMPVRLRAARRGSAGARRALVIVPAVLLVVNVVEAFVPAFPIWMRVEMIVIAVLMAALVVVGLRAARSGTR